MHARIDNSVANTYPDKCGHGDDVYIAAKVLSGLGGLDDPESESRAAEIAEAGARLLERDLSDRLGPCADAAALLLRQSPLPDELMACAGHQLARLERVHIDPKIPSQRLPGKQEEQ